MIFPAALISVLFLISASMGSEEVIGFLSVDGEKNGEIDLLKYQISDSKKTNEILTLTNQFREDIGKLGEIIKNGGMNQNNQTNSNNQTKNVVVETGEVVTTPLPKINNQTTSKTEIMDPCPRGTEGGDLHEIQIPGSDSFKVVCDSAVEIGSGWLKVYRKLPWSQIFNRTYEDYERGFGDVGPLWGDEFFIGLTRLHILTKGNPHEVLLKTYLFDKNICDNFVVGDRSEGYKVKSIGNCTRDVWIIPKQGSKFSTFDRDEDGVPDRNFAEECEFGWWFNPGMSIDKYFIEMYIRRTG
ncbi:fibrinogen alpha chain-like [Drosophila bipectinata]|uniref:fibrinogen alpha chain-like n=1 Tax=Drosophila bipectinata TaxID=42026 RepID=UPI001C89888A|nr:fibrinogen alpha chain-like [Drosophila bipectinata]